MITPEQLAQLMPTTGAYYAAGGRYGSEWHKPPAYPALFADPEYYNLPAQLADMKAGELAVDILCGNPVPGGLSIALARSQRGAKVLGLDPSQNLLDTARVNFESVGATGAEWVLSDDEILDLPDNTADVIVNRLGLHHIVDIESTLTEYRRLLRARGRVVFLDFSVPDQDPDADAFINGIYRGRDKTHVRIRSVEDITRDLSRLGFRVDAVVPWRVDHVTTEFGFANPEDRAAYIATFQAGSEHARDVHSVELLPTGELKFSHPAMVLVAHV